MGIPIFDNILNGGKIILWILISTKKVYMSSWFDRPYILANRGIILIYKSTGVYF